MQAGSHAFHSEFRQRTLKLPAHRKFLPAWNHNLSLSLPKEFRVPKGAPISNSRSLRGRLRNAAARSVWVFGGLKAVRAQAVTAWNFAERGHDFAVRGCHLSSRVKSTCKQIFGQRLPSRFANFAFRLTWFPELTASGSSSSAPLSTRSKPLLEPYRTRLREELFVAGESACRGPCGSWLYSICRVKPPPAFGREIQARQVGLSVGSQALEEAVAGFSVPRLSKIPARLRLLQSCVRGRFRSLFMQAAWPKF